jgi:hypothetical protein
VTVPILGILLSPCIISFILGVRILFSPTSRS